MPGIPRSSCSRGSGRLPARRALLTVITLGSLHLVGCSSESLTGPTPDSTRSSDAAPRAPSAVQDLVVVNTTATSVTVRWTQVGIAGLPASYRVKYGSAPLDWTTAQEGCEQAISGTRIGAAMACTIEGLQAGETYDIQLMSFDSVADEARSAGYSNMASGTPEDTPISVEDDSGIWLAASRLRRIPASGTAWENMAAAAEQPCGGVDLADQEQTNNVCTMAKALVFARTGETAYRDAVVQAISEIVSAPKYNGRALALGRLIGTYVLAADLIDLENHDPALDQQFRDALRVLRTTPTFGAATDLVNCHEKRPNNWGAHCGASRMAIAAYLGDKDDLARAALVFKGYIGDRAAYAGFNYGVDLSWQCDPAQPVGINPAGCSRDGLSLDGVLADDQRRGGVFTTSPPRENYVWEALQGLVAQAVILERAGYPAFEWEDRALLRAVNWLHSINDYPAEGDDTWQTPLLNHFYGSDFPFAGPSQAGKNVGWTDWTHAGRR